MRVHRKLSAGGVLAMSADPDRNWVASPCLVVPPLVSTVIDALASPVGEVVELDCAGVRATETCARPIGHHNLPISARCRAGVIARART